jgi:hypothetical protein
MKDYRFYLEYDRPSFKKKATVKNPGDHSGNVIAVIYVNGVYWSGSQGKEPCYDAIGALMFHPNSSVCSTGVSLNYLRERCKRIPESIARQIHPNLFTVLDNN